ncbi:uncharacterized protein LOC117604999 isoform X6 [Osmia lignaria lignaria]|uniref:uncharacterized protein LOC117604999 isoform X6 n=1 Tax=Osmia lignaria lignaria TaxID=1437193 RepID=UPI00402B60C7
METKTDEPRMGDLDENPFDWMICKSGARRIFAESLLSCVRYCANQVPKRMTLDRLRILAALLVILMPRPLTYILLYPIFRLVFGNLYPAYASYKAVRTKNVKEYVKWMMYWIVFALFTCAETFTDVFFSFWFPFYYEIKTILVVWLLSPATKGSSILYRRFVHPALIRREAEIDDALARATEQGYTAVLHLGTKGVNYATTVLMQTAIKPFRQLNANVPNEPSTSGAQLASGVSSSARPVPASTSQRVADQLDGQLDEIANSDQSSTTSHHELLLDREMLSASDSSTDCDEDMIELRLFEEEEREEMQERQGQQKRTRVARHHSASSHDKWLRSKTHQSTMVYFKYSDDDD